VEINPNSGLIYWMMGNLLSKQHQWEQAIYYYQKAIVFEPNQELFYLKLAEILVKTNQINPAINCYKKAIEINPQQVFAHQELDRLLQLKFQEATEDQEDNVGFDEGGVDLASAGLETQLKTSSESNIQTALIASGNEQFFVENPLDKKSENPEVEFYKQQAELLMNQGRFDQA
ncbi:tetratricopeptide repeat protein, partial [Planktothrix sp.]|uniref:tetratricopeptide repeat protein n=1 Tax=Planktothrix sp. TaxID=3088171 RepID=UPI0038D4EA32